MDEQGYSVEASRLSFLRARNAERVALAQVLPEMTGNATYTRYDQAVERSGLVVREADQLNASLSVSATLSARAIHNLRLAELRAEHADLALADVRRLARASVARTFFAALALRRTAELSRSQLARALEYEDAARARASAGVLAVLDVTRAEQATLVALQRVEDADVQLLRAADALGASLGMDQAVEPSTEVPSIIPVTAAEMQSQVGQRPDIRAAASEAALASSEQTNAWLRLLPNLAVTWTGTWTGATTTLNPNETSWGLATTLAIPFYDGGERYAAMRDGALAQEQATAKLRDLRRRATAEVRDAWRRRESLGRSLERSRRAMEMARTLAEAAETGYRAGSLTSFEVQDARRVLDESEVALTLRGLEYQVALIDLLSAGGQL